MSERTLSAIRRGLRAELPTMLRLAGPVVAAEVGWMAMGLVDLAFVGRLGPNAIGGVSIGNTLFFAVTVFGIGMLLGLDYLVSHAHGGGKADEANRSLLTGIWLAAILSAVLMSLLFLAAPHLSILGLEEGVIRDARPYLTILTLGMPLLLLFVALRRYLQAVGVVVPMMIALVSANLLNVLGNWVFVFGHLGAPALGVAGSAWATCVSRLYLLVFAVVTILLRERRAATGLLTAPRGIESGRMGQLLRLGWPAAIQITLEVGVFSTATILAGHLGTLSLAAHQVALAIISFTFMVPLGMSSAGAVRVGQALGAGDPRGAARAGWTALFTSVAFMSVSAVLLLLVGRPFAALFTDDPGVIATAAVLLRVAAFFQIFDGTQVTATGVLRGAGDTTRPMIVNLVAHWLIGLPVGATLAFALHGGILGLWGGLCVGLIFCATILLVVWGRKVKVLLAGVSAART